MAARKIFCCLLCRGVSAKTLVIKYGIKSPVVFGDVKCACAGLEEIQTILSADTDESAPIKFGFRKPVTNTMHVSTIRGMCLGIHATNVHLNSVSNTVLEAKIFKRQRDFEMLRLSDADFKPTFRAGDQLVWVSTDTSDAYGTEELATHLVNLFVKHLEEEIATSEE